MGSLWLRNWGRGNVIDCGTEWSFFGLGVGVGESVTECKIGCGLFGLGVGVGAV